MSDTGCQSCLAGIIVLYRLGLTPSDLIPVTMRMHSADNKDINILGATMLHITAKNANGRIFETRQMVYITDCSEKFFLSRGACVDLHIIPKDFPKFVETAHLCYAVLRNETGSPDCSPTNLCDCPRRRKPPPPPRRLPFPATDENRERLQKYLLDFYRSSTFNTCNHQPLPPLELMIDPTANPVAYHTPIPVPLYWQQEVKAGLDQDVRLGVLEPVPIGEPVTWCHCMVICAKKNGKPRRTVDFQPLNAQAKRETHHTRSLFHQARSVPHGKKKTVLDAWNGYHSVPFVQRYRYKTTPKATLHLAMDTQGDTMKSLLKSPTKPIALTTPFSGQIPWKRASIRRSNGLTFAAAMESYSTRRNSSSAAMWWNLLASKSPRTESVPAKITLRPSVTIQPGQHL
ncbi:hypothetical protein RRG08_040042 [Elysia crispata]|uniref:Uncharacterized protein n=1 Tax=Elysia crispata TaxID=231223 RepID=A0AAE0XVX0_9GAST|nr:hypothetical protein RRG08_040042 [Elysia crispata]